MIVVTDEIGFAQEVATDVAFMDQGIIIERAPSNEFFRKPREARTKQFLQQITPENSYEILKTRRNIVLRCFKMEY